MRRLLELALVLRDGGSISGLPEIDIYMRKSALPDLRPPPQHEGEFLSPKKHLDSADKG